MSPLSGGVIPRTFSWRSHARTAGALSLLEWTGLLLKISRIALAPTCLLLLGCLSACIAGSSYDASPADSPAPGALSKNGPDSYSRTADSRACAACHEEHFQLWEDGGHNKIACEICHGSVGDHVRPGANPRPRMRLRGEAELCLSCHGGPSGTSRDGVPQVEDLAAHLRVVSEKHSVRTDVTKTRGRCVFCHDPHSLE